MNYLNNGMRGIMRTLGNDKAKDVTFVKKVGETNDNKSETKTNAPRANGLFSVFGRKTAIEKVKRR